MIKQNVDIFKLWILNFFFIQYKSLYVLRIQKCMIRRCDMLLLGVVDWNEKTRSSFIPHVAYFWVTLNLISLEKIEK